MDGVASPPFRVAGVQTPRCLVVCRQSSFDLCGILRDASRCPDPWTKESCEFPESTAERAENPLAVGEGRGSSPRRNLKLPERPPVGLEGPRRFRIASVRKRWLRSFDLRGERRFLPDVQVNCEGSGRI